MSTRCSNAVTPRTKIVFLANPNNPTGTYIPYSEVKRLHAGLPPHVLLVLDAAYAEYVRRNDYASGLELVSTSENVVMTRTFSKIYGLANLRIGWLYGPAHVVDALNRIRSAFNVNGAALAAGAAAITDDAHVAAALAHNDRWLPGSPRSSERSGFRSRRASAISSSSTFPHEPGKTAKEADAFWRARGLILRGSVAMGCRMRCGSPSARRKPIARSCRRSKDFLGRAASARG